ncbi:MAG: DUF4956 domain-containing protein [Planctomycetes bacterium]|nr:DUF4956 domain-containing protein [Planctomycetota bacterium]
MIATAIAQGMFDTSEQLVADGLRIGGRLLGATGFGLIVSLLYAYSRRPRDREPGFRQTLVLLAPLITMVTVAVGSNVAAAFTLVGTLAIVRFRTAIRDSRDTAFVMFSVAAGLALGSGSYIVATLGTIVVGAAILAMPPRGAAQAPGSQTALLRLVLVPPDADVGPALAAVGSIATAATILRANADLKAGSMDLRLRLRGVDPSRFPAVLAGVLELPEVVRASCEVDEDGAAGEGRFDSGSGPPRGE